MYRVCLTEEQRRELKERTRQPGLSPRVRERLEMVRLSDAGWGVMEIAPHLLMHHQTVRRWIKRFLELGFAGLEDQFYTGPTSALTPTVVEAVRQLLREGGQSWTAAQIAAWAAERFGVQRSVRQWRRMLRRAKIVYRRTTRSLQHKRQPEVVAQKQTQLAELEKGGRRSP